MNIIENISSWAKSITLAVIIVSILEMILPNNKTKKYVKMVMGLFILFNIISPFVKDSNSINFKDVNTENYLPETSPIEVNQQSMDERLEELYIEEIEKDITKKLEKQGYIVNNCKVEAKISNNEEETGIKKIALKVEKNENYMSQNNQENNEEDNQIEEKLVTQIQKIKKIDTNISDKKQENNNNLDKSDIQNIKKFLIEEYEVSEKCLKIN